MKGKNKQGSTSTSGWDKVTKGSFSNNLAITPLAQQSMPSQVYTLIGSSVIAPALAFEATLIRDTAILEKSVDLFKRTTTNELKHVAFLKDRNFASEKLHDLVINDHYQKMSDFHRPLIKASISETSHPITTRKKFTEFKNNFDKSMFSEYGVKQLKSMRNVLGASATMLTATHVITSDDKIEALRNETSATIGSVSMASLSRNAAHAGKALTKTAATVSGGLVGGIIGAVADEGSDGNGLPSYLLTQSYFSFKDLAVLKPAQLATATAFKGAMIQINLSENWGIFSGNEIEFREALKTYNSNVNQIRAKSSPIGRAAAMADPIFDLTKSTSDLVLDIGRHAPKTIAPAGWNDAKGVLKQLHAHIENTGYMSSTNINKLTLLSYGTAAAGIGLSAWQISLAEDKSKETAVQGTTLTTGVMGGVAATSALQLFTASASPTVAVAAGLCATNPICVGSVAVAGAFGASAIASSAWKRQSRGPVDEGQRTLETQAMDRDFLMTSKKQSYRKKY